MRIDFVITELFPGGAERCLTEIALGLASRGDRVRVFSLGPLPRGERAICVERLLAAGVSVDSGDVAGMRSLGRGYRQLRRWLRGAGSVRGELCQTFLFHANVLGTHAARAEGVGRCVGGLRVAEPNWLRCQVERRLVGKMDEVLCVSEAVRKFAVDRLRAEPARTKVIPNGVDVTRFDDVEPYRWERLGWPDDAEVSLFLGRLHPQKGLESLQRQIDRIAPDGSRRRLLLVGDGPLRASLAEWCAKVGPNRVQLLPWQPDVAPLLVASRLLILPSHYEGMPNVVLEAMAAGRPVVCSRVEGSEELVVEHRQQQTFTAADDQAMADLIERLLDDRDAAEAIGRQNRRHVERFFSINRMVDAYREVYARLLDG